MRLEDKGRLARAVAPWTLPQQWGHPGFKLFLACCLAFTERHLVNV